MSDDTILRVDGDVLMRWRWEVPNDPFLDFVFQPDDKVVREDPNLEWDTDRIYEGFYETTVGKAEGRLDNLGLTLEEIEQTSASCVGIDEEDADFLLLTDEDFFEEYGDHDDFLETFDGSPSIGERRDEILRKAQRTDLGYLPELWNLRRKLEKRSDEATLQLDPRPVWERREDPEWFEERSPIKTEFEAKVPLDLDYINSAKVHFSSHKFHLVYIELAIALEIALEDYIEAKSGEFDIDVDGIFQDLSMVRGLKLAVSVVGDLDVEEELVQRIEDSYNMRSNVVHNRARNFRIPETAAAIDAVEELVTRLEAAK